MTIDISRTRHHPPQFHGRRRRIDFCRGDRACRFRGAAAARGTSMALSPWVTISTDDTVAIMSPAAEMGQGSLTSLPLILAEELDADWAKVRVVVAPPNDELYKNPAFGYMYTAGSNAVTSYFKELRQFGAQVRKVLLANAAKHWNVPVAELTTGPNVVMHEKSGRRLSYGEIAAFAEVPAKAPEVAESELKKPEQFRLIGKDVMRVELPQKVNGTAQYSIDVQVPGMLYGAILRSPVEGAAPDNDRRRQGEGDRRRGADRAAALRRRRDRADAVGGVRAPRTRSTSPGPMTARRGASTATNALVAFAAAARDMSQPTKLWAKEGDAPAALQTAATVVERGIPQRSRLSRPDGAAERSRLGVARRRRLRGLVRRAVEDDRGDGRGRCARHQARQDHLPRHADGRRLRAARPPRRGIRPRRGGAVERRQEAGQDDVDARR